MAKFIAREGFDIRGDKEIAMILDTILPREANNLMRSTVDGIASEIKKKAAQNAREKGLKTISKAIKHKRKRSSKITPVSQVFVERGRGAKNDAWYWHFHEFGTAPRFTKSGKYVGRISSEKPFIRPAFEAVMARSSQTIREQFQKKLVKRINAVKRKAARA